LLSCFVSSIYQFLSEPPIDGAFATRIAPQAAEESADQSMILQATQSHDLHVSPQVIRTFQCF
jgi:hypothetical protein